MRFLIVSICVIFLYGCSSIDIKEEQEIIVEESIKKGVVLPTEFMKSCKDLEELQAGTFKDVMNYTVDLSIKYSDCKNRHEILKKFIEKKS